MVSLYEIAYFSGGWAICRFENCENEQIFVIVEVKLTNKWDIAVEIFELGSFSK